MAHGVNGCGLQQKPFKQSSWKTCLPKTQNSNSRSKTPSSPDQGSSYNPRSQTEKKEKKAFMKTELFSLVLITQLLALHIKEERTTRLLFPRGQTQKAGWGGRRGTGRHPAQPRVPQTPAAGSAASCWGTGPHPGRPTRRQHMGSLGPRSQWAPPLLPLRRALRAWPWVPVLRSDVPLFVNTLSAAALGAFGIVRAPAVPQGCFFLKYFSFL